ncbi:MAG: SHOCT domain-containing protein [Betaproteobacteria bacterium]|jgi:putative membrane protein|nr:SHOCT domain-containing protein [Betaproteobacteria bacterium]
MYGYEHGGMAWGWPGMILMWLIPVLLIVLVVRLLAGKKGEPPGRARQILDERYAAGEIEREDYLKRIEDLKR